MNVLIVFCGKIAGDVALWAIWKRLSLKETLNLILPFESLQIALTITGIILLAWGHFLLYKALGNVDIVPQFQFNIGKLYFNRDALFVCSANIIAALVAFKLAADDFKKIKITTMQVALIYLLNSVWLLLLNWNPMPL